MKVLFVALFAALLAIAYAATPQKAVVVSYPDDTPESVLQEAKNMITAAGGMITHEYKLIKAFAAKGPEAIFSTVQTLADKHAGVVEDDQMLHANGGAF